MKEKLVWLLAIFLLGDSALRAVRTNLTLGNAMMYSITVAVWGYALFQRRIDAFCAAGAGRVLKYVFFAGCGAYLLFALGLFAASFAHPATGNEKAVVVLGAGLRGEQVSGLLARRLDAALAYYRQNPDVLLVVSGGQGPDEAIPEAEAMARYLQAHGVPGENILKEEKSESTQQNFEFSRALLEQAGIRADEPIAFTVQASPLTSKIRAYSESGSGLAMESLSSSVNADGTRVFAFTIALSSPGIREITFRAMDAETNVEAAGIKWGIRIMKE